MNTGMPWQVRMKYMAGNDADSSWWPQVTGIGAGGSETSWPILGRCARVPARGS